MFLWFWKIGINLFYTSSDSFARFDENGAEVIDADTISDSLDDGCCISRALFKDKFGNAYMCSHDGSTDRIYYMSVDPESKTCS